MQALTYNRPPCCNHTTLSRTHIMQLLFVHGSGSSAESFRFQLAAFPSARAVNLPGHPHGELLPSVGACSAWLHEYVQREALRDLVLCGHSLGGAVTLQYALDYPDDLQGIMLIGSGARLKVHPRFLEPLEAAVQDPTAWNAQNGGFDRVAPALAEIMNRRRIENGPRAMLNDMRACNDFDIMSRIAEITLPAFAIVGTDDVMTPPKYSTFLAAQLSDCTMQEVPGATHWGYAEQPDLYNAAIAQFIATLDARKT